MIDEIYELFIWDSTLSPEEYNARIQRGLELASKVRYLPPFLQPILPQRTKSHWEPCAQVLAARSNEELHLYLYPLFEWLQDMNWPGADTIWNRLLCFPFSDLEISYNIAVKEARRTNDEGWLEILEDFKTAALK